MFITELFSKNNYLLLKFNTLSQQPANVQNVTCLTLTVNATNFLGNYMLTTTLAVEVTIYSQIYYLCTEYKIDQEIN